MSRSPEIIARAVDRDRCLDEADAAELLEAIQSTPADARHLREQLLIDELLGQLFIPERRDFINRVTQALADQGGDRFVAQTLARVGRAQPRPPRVRFALAWLLTGLATGAAAALLLARSTGGRPDGQSADLPRLVEQVAPPERIRVPPAVAPDPFAPPRVLQTAGTVIIAEKAGSRPAVAGDRLLPGSVLFTSPARGGATVAFDSARVHLDPDTALTTVGPESTGTGTIRRAFVLMRGRIAADTDVAADSAASPAPTGRSRLSFATPHGLVSADRARFALAVEDRQTRVTVDSGAVEVRRHGHDSARTVEARHSAVLVEGTEAVSGIEAARGLAFVLSGADEADLLDADHVHSGDRLLEKRLAGLGFEAKLVPSGRLTPMQARGARLLVVSSSVSSPDSDLGLRDLPVPLIVSESGLFDDLGLTGPCAEDDCGVFEGTGHLFVKDPSHPLAAGLSGTVLAVPWRTVAHSWGSPTPSASWVATLPGHPDKAALFAYERGARMVGVVAPARRVGFFLRRLGQTKGLTSEGWALFDAAARWAAGAE